LAKSLDDLKVNMVEAEKAFESARSVLELVEQDKAKYDDPQATREAMLA